VLELAKLIDLIVGFASPVVQNKLQRSELVIKLLKQLNLDSDHPPADFTAVYQYTLVEYGIGKPKPVLEMFRQAEIQAIFRKALEQNNPSLLLKNGETFLAGHSLGDQIQVLGIDARQEFYQFAAVFIEVAKRTRTPAEVLTNQRLESLHRQISSIQDRLHRLPTLEAMRTEMARLAAQSYPMLPGAIATPALAQERQLQERQCRAFALAQQMKGWFETLGYRFEPYEVWQDDYFEWIIDIPVRRGRYDRILVRGVDGEVGLGDIKALRQSVETQRADEGWLVTARRISRAAREEVEKEENHDLGCYTLDELLDQDADFGGYLDWLESEIGRRGIDQKYVPLACTKEEIDPDTKQRIGMSRYDDRDGWIDGYIDLWLDDPAKEHISVLGEFGTGKTWFAFHYASQALKRYREAQKRGVERPRLPLVIPLRDYAKAVSVESLFSEFFFRKHEVRSLTYSAFEQLNRMGKLLLIFDGFDEMAARVDRQEMINNFWELAKVVVPGAKVILTCRTEHFPEAKEGRALLNAQLQASTASLTGEMPQFEVLELEKFNDEQIGQVMSQQAEPATVEQVMSNPQLLDLARRPVMTELILEALPDIEAGKPVDMSRVYLYAVRRKMERDIKEERTFTSLAEKLYFLCELSWEMLSSDRMSLNYREFPDRIRRLFGSVVQEEKDLDHWHYDMMGQTMLIRNADGDYMPAHRSLLEFFVAYKFAAELGALAPDFLELAQMQSCLDTDVKPQDYTWSGYFQRELDDTGRSVAIAPLKTFVGEAMEKLRLTVGQAPLTKAVLDLLVPTLTPFLQKIKHPLMHVIEATQNKPEETVGYVGGNTATLLTKLNESALSHQDLSNTVIQNADLVHANLWGTSFLNAIIKKPLFPEIFGSIFALTYSPDGKFFATAGATCEINLWNATNNQLLNRFKGHKDWIRYLIFTANAKTLISAAFDQTVRMWDVETGDCTKILYGHTSRLNCVTVSSDSKYLASASDDQTIRVWDFMTGECIQTLEGHTAAVEAVVIHNEARLLISGASDKSIKIWDLQTRECLRSLDAHTDRVLCLALSPDGKTFASSSRDHTVRLWDVETGACLKILEGHDRRVRTVIFNSDGKLLASGCNDQEIRLWDVETGNCLKILLGHTDWIRTIAFSPDGHTLSSGSEDQTIRHWDVKTGECLTTLQGYTGEIRSIVLSPDGRTLAIGCEDKCLRMWQGDFDGLSTPKTYVTLAGHTSRINSVSISPDSHIVATASFDCSIKLWDIATCICLRTLEGHYRSLNAVVFSPDGKFLASTSADCTVRLWNAQDGECIALLQGHDNWLWTVAISPDNCLIASGGDDQTIRVWNVQTGECFAVFKEHRGGINSVVFTSDSRILVSAGADQMIRLWNISGKECFKSWLAHDSYITSLAISPDSKKLVSSGDDKSLKIWDLRSGECLKVLKGHTDIVRSVVFTPDGSKLISGSSDQTIRIWDVKTGEYLQTIRPPRPYEGMNITGVKGLTEAEKAKLKALGAIEH
jgi:WD40 repeat protein